MNSNSSRRPNLLIQIAKNNRFPILLVGHLLVFSAVYYLALTLRFESFFPSHNPNLFWVGLPLFAFVKLAVFYAMKNFHGWWRYVTFSDLVSLARSSTIAMAILVAIDFFIGPLQHYGEIGQQIPKTVVVIDWAFTIAVLCALRSMWRLWDEQLSSSTSIRKRKRALLIGSDTHSAKLAHMINSRPSLDVQVVGLVSQAEHVTTRFSDLRVVGATSEIEELCKKFRASAIYVPSGGLDARDMRQLIDKAATLDVKINVVPKLDNLLKGGTEIPIREVKFDDLLRRPPVKLDEQAIGSLVRGKTLMVTGAGGSIGSEICRQLLKFQPATLILAGRGENRLYHIHRELAKQSEGTTLVPYLVNITDKRRMENLFETYGPQVVFHAAAHKHVPLVEMNIGEAIINNVYGTKVVADLADKYEAEEFVLVSTDKSVNPTSAMGCTKQLAERYCLALGEISRTKFVATRFGNVLGSEGSVVPLFKEQIRRGGPITVTDERMTRYFMTIPEAAQLVVQAATMGSGGEIFVLEMGEAVLIKDLALDLIRLAGLPKNSIDIVYTGIRPGEKLYEELYYNDEKPLPTTHAKILTALHRGFVLSEVTETIAKLVAIAYQDPGSIRAAIKEAVPEFHKHTDTPANLRETSSTATAPAPHYKGLGSSLDPSQLLQSGAGARQ